MCHQVVRCNMVIRKLGRQPYQPVWRAMQRYTEQRTPESADELWVVEHPALYTQGLNGKAEHLLRASNIPLVAIDRGGQITYHGPGQLIIYLLFDLKRHGWGVRHLVTAIESSIIELLANYRITAHARADAPGVYVNQAKIAALGLRIRRHCSYHGLSLNVNMDLTPFDNINPCGHAGMAVTQLSEQGVTEKLESVADKLLNKLYQTLQLDDEIQLETELPILEQTR